MQFFLLTVLHLFELDLLNIAALPQFCSYLMVGRWSSSNMFKRSRQQTVGNKRRKAATGIHMVHVRSLKSGKNVESHIGLSGRCSKAATVFTVSAVFADGAGSGQRSSGKRIWWMDGAADGIRNNGRGNVNREASL